MALLACPECGNQVSSSAEACPKCGWLMDEPTPVPGLLHRAPAVRGVNLIKVFWGGVAVFFMLPCVCGLFALGKDTPARATQTPVVAKPLAEVAPAAVLDPKKPRALSKEQAAIAAMTPDDDASHEKLIASLQAQGVIGEIEYGKSMAIVQVWVPFYALDFDDKKVLVWGIWVNGIRKSHETDVFSVVLKDRKTGAEVGSYNEWSGLKLKAN